MICDCVLQHLCYRIVSCGTMADEILVFLYATMTANAKPSLGR